jgi:thiamine kinase-like enzyme
VTRFVDGHPLPVEEMRSPEAIARVVAALKPFHEGESIPARFDSFRVVEAYVAAAAERGVPIPDVYERARALAARIEAARGSQPLRPCHNDLLNANFILGDRLWIVDWEYAGMGDVFFDLANFSVNHELGPDEDDELLRRYFGERTETDAAALTLMRFMSDLREATWGLVQQGVSELDFDFAEYARHHFERLERTAAAPRFRAALRTLEQD